MESILDDIDAMIGELDDLNFNPNHKSDLKKKDPDVLDIKDETANGGQNFTDLINELAAFNPAPASKDRTLKRGESNETMTSHQLIRGGSLRSRSEEKDPSSPRKSSVDSSAVSRDTSGSMSRDSGSLSRDSSSLSRKRSLTRQNSSLDNFTLLPSPSENIKIHMSDGNMIKTVRVERSQTSWDLCLSLVLKNELTLTGSWTLVEQIVSNSSERTLEDHEVVIKVYKSWGANSQNKLCLVNNKKKWEFLENPEMFFSSSVLDRVRGRSRDEIEEVLTEEYFSEKAPPVEGYLYFKDQKHSWARKYFILRSSGLYYSTKGKSRAPQDLACFTTLQDMGIYFCVDARVDHKSPTEHALSFKPSSSSVSLKDMKCVGAETEQDLLRWYHALRVVKYGDKIPENRACVLLEVTQEIERLHEQKKQAREAERKKEEEKKKAQEAEERKSQERLAAVASPKPVLLKKGSPPPPSPKPQPMPRKPAPSPKPDLRKKLQLPVPPAKPRVESPKPVIEPRTKPVLAPPPQSTKPAKPPPPPPSQEVPAPAIYSLSDSVAPNKEFTPNKTGFAEAQVQLARSLNGTIKRGNSVTGPSPPATSPKPASSVQPAPPKREISGQAALPRPNSPSRVVYQPRSPSPLTNHPPGPVDDLPPPPLDFFVEQPTLKSTNPPPAIATKPEFDSPGRSKISEMVKSLNSQQSSDQPAKQVDMVTGGSERSSSVSQLTSMLNRTLKKSQTTTGLVNQPPPPKPVSKPSMGGMARSLTCPQMVPPNETRDSPPPPASSVQQRAADLAKIMASKPLQKPIPVLPAQSPYANQPPVPPPKQFSNGTAPRHPVFPHPQHAPPQPSGSVRLHGPIIQPMRGPSPLNQPMRGPPPLNQPMRAPPPAVPPAANYTIPALPSRKDSLIASRQRTTSGSSGGSHHSSLRPGSAASHYQDAGVVRPPHYQDAGVVRPPPRTISRDNLRSSSRNDHRGSRENLAMNTASTINTTSEHGIPDMFQRSGYPRQDPQPNRQEPPPNRQEPPPNRQEPPPNHPLHYPPQRLPSPGGGRGRESPARPWHDTLLRDTVTSQEAPREHPLSVNINEIRQTQTPPPRGQFHNGNTRGTYNPGSAASPGNPGNPGSAGSGASEEVMYEYIEDVPSKSEHLHHWLANQGNQLYDEDTISVSSDNMLSTTPLTPPPRTDSRRSNARSNAALPHLYKPWYHGNIARDVANSLLAAHGLSDGLFLIRSSTANSGDFVLSMTHGGHVKHFQITQRGGSPPWYAIEDGPCFPDINKLVDHYSSSADRLPSKLSCYCVKS